MRLTARLDSDQLEELAELIVQKLTATQRPNTYDQDHLPEGLTRRAYLEAARRGEFQTAKIGKKIIVEREVLNEWIAARSRNMKPPLLARLTSSDVDPELAETIAANGARCR